jgi:hypothetical protein
VRGGERRREEGERRREEGGVGVQLMSVLKPEVSVW